MTVGCGRGIHDGGFRLHPGSNHFAAHGTGGKTDTRIAADTFHLPGVRQGVDIQDSMIFSKPYRGLDWRPIPFETLQVEIPLGSEGGQVWAMHGNTFMLDAVGMFACTIVPGMRILSVPHTADGIRYTETSYSIDTRTVAIASVGTGGYAMAGRVDGKVALVTGGASGIGRATALTFAREGAKLVVADMNEEGGQQTVHMITENGGEATFVQVDVISASAVEALISKTVETYGRLDCAHNNTGISGIGIAGTHRALTADYPEERWQQVIAINLTSVWLCMKYEILQMLPQGGGTIVNTASVAGLVGLPGNCAYVASKHGVVGITRTAALEYAKAGIRVNCVCPGYIQTPMTAPGMEDPERMALMLAREPVGRMGNPEEVAEAVVWLCSDAASFVTGHTMTVDGGYVAQ
jgi:NAD(P)-dependent dehydrogenase (short-subunit alcohol dehydrogenase family)